METTTATIYWYLTVKVLLQEIGKSTNFAKNFSIWCNEFSHGKEKEGKWEYKAQKKNVSEPNQILINGEKKTEGGN